MHDIPNCPLCRQDHVQLPVVETGPPYLVVDDQEFRFYCVCPTTNNKVFFVTKIVWVGEEAT